jgi:hypothetical protein
MTHGFFKMRTLENKSTIWTVKTQRFFKIEHRNILDHWTLETEVESLKEQDREGIVSWMSPHAHMSKYWKLNYKKKKLMDWIFCQVFSIENYCGVQATSNLIDSLSPSFLHWQLSWIWPARTDWHTFHDDLRFIVVVLQSLMLKELFNYVCSTTQIIITHQN